MQRELEFRAFNHETGKWNIANQHNIRHGCLKSNDVVEQTIVQYTGKKDCEGTKIFEGDILSYFDMWKIVGWNDVTSQWGLRRGLFTEFKYHEQLATVDLEKSKIVGNIFENENLIKE